MKIKEGDIVEADCSENITGGYLKVISEEKYREITNSTDEFPKNTIFLYDGVETETVTPPNLNEYFVKSSKEEAVVELKESISDLESKLNFIEKS